MNNKKIPENLGFWKDKVVVHRTDFENNPSNETAAMLLMFAEDMVEEIEQSIFVH
jgi:hypothetical protein